MGREEMRAADGDREAVAERLRTALNEGRLDLGEYDERLQRAYAAKTYGELDSLLRDLPTVTPAEQQQLAPLTGGAATEHWRVGPDGRYTDATRRWLTENWAPWAVASGTTAAIWLFLAIMETEWSYFWPMWVAGPWGVVLVISTIAGLNSGEPQRWAEKQARKEERRRQRREAGEEDHDE